MEENGWSIVKKEPEETNWFLRFLTKHKRRRIIHDPINKLPYMFRYFLLFRDRDGSEEKHNPKFNVFFHKIVQSDLYDLHDHPFWYFTIILKGGYWEYTPKGKFWRGPGHMRLSRPKSLHRLEVEQNRPCYTLFFRFKRVRSWGFLHRGRWIDNKTYLAGRYYDETTI